MQHVNRVPKQNCHRSVKNGFWDRNCMVKRLVSEYWNVRSCILKRTRQIPKFNHSLPTWSHIVVSLIWSSQSLWTSSTDLSKSGVGASLNLATALSICGSYQQTKGFKSFYYQGEWLYNMVSGFLFKALVNYYSNYTIPPSTPPIPLDLS